MNSVTLYFAGFFKHGEVQHLFKGPFLDWDDANNSITAEGTQPRDPRHVVVEVILPISEMSVR